MAVMSCYQVCVIAIMPLDRWGRSSVGRTPDLHSGGKGFESPRLHL